MRTKPLSLAEVEYIAFSLAEKFMTWNEPIPEFGSRFPHILESCLAVPFARFGKKDLYRGVVDKGIMLFYLLMKIENLHAFHCQKIKQMKQKSPLV